MHTYGGQCCAPILYSKTHVKIQSLFGKNFGFIHYKNVRGGAILMTALGHTYGLGVCGTYEGVSPICPFPGERPPTREGPEEEPETGERKAPDKKEDSFLADGQPLLLNESWPTEDSDYGLAGAQVAGPLERTPKREAYHMVRGKKGVTSFRVEAPSKKPLLNKEQAIKQARETGTMPIQRAILYPVRGEIEFFGEDTKNDEDHLPDKAVQPEPEWQF